jgi:hypothetical protein
VTVTVKGEDEIRHRPRLLDAVLDQHDGRRSCSTESRDALEERGRPRRIEVGRRLVEHEQARERSQHPGER